MGAHPNYFFRSLRFGTISMFHLEGDKPATNLLELLEQRARTTGPPLTSSDSCLTGRRGKRIWRSSESSTLQSADSALPETGGPIYAMVPRIPEGARIRAAATISGCEAESADAASPRIS